METSLNVLGLWTLVAIPLAILVGRFIRLGTGEAPVGGLAVPAHGIGKSCTQNPTVHLNLHAYDNCLTNEFNGSNRHTIDLQAEFGTLNGAHPDLLRTNDILLTPGLDFHFVDGNAYNEDPDGIN